MDDSPLRRLLQQATAEALARGAQNLGRIPVQIPAVAVERQTARTEHAFAGIIPIFKRLFVISSIASILLLTSISEYGFFYLVIMPKYKATSRVYFDYSGIAKHPAQVPESVCFDDEVYGITKKNTSPWAFTDLFAKHSQWESFQSECIPNPVADRRLLKSGNSYYIEVTLDLPESDINLESGIFTVKVELASHNGTELATSVRSTRIPHETPWVSTVRKGVTLIPLLIGAVHENRRVTVPSFRHFIENTNLPLRYVTVRLIREVSESQVMKPLEVMTADIRIGKELSDYQLILKEWFFTCYTIGSSILFFSQLLVLVILRLHIKEQRSKREMEEEASLNLGDLQESGFENDPTWDEGNEVPLNYDVPYEQAPAGSSVNETENERQPTRNNYSDVEEIAEEPTNININGEGNRERPLTPSLNQEETTSST